MKINNSNEKNNVIRDLRNNMIYLDQETSEELNVAEMLIQMTQL